MTVTKQLCLVHVCKSSRCPSGMGNNSHGTGFISIWNSELNLASGSVEHDRIHAQMHTLHKQGQSSLQKGVGAAAACIVSHRSGAQTAQSDTVTGRARSQDERSRATQSPMFCAWILWGLPDAASFETNEVATGYDYLYTCHPSCQAKALPPLETRCLCPIRTSSSVLVYKHC